MKCRLRKLHDNKSWIVAKNLTSLGKDNCDINVKCKQQIVDRKHAFISVDEENNVYTISDNNSTHGTYLNDRRLQNTNVRLRHGDVIRLGHGGPRFEVVLENSRAENPTNMSNLPTISVASSPSSPYTSHQYGRYSGYAKSDKSNVVPHPPVKQRPVSANPSNGPFQPTSKPAISGNWTNGFVTGVDTCPKMCFDSYVDFDRRTQVADERLGPVINFETECHKKESVIETLREEIDYLRKCIGTSQSKTFSTGCHEKIAALHNQIQIKSEDNDCLRTENINLRTENDGLREENNRLHADTRVHTENLNLRDENERLKGSSHDVSQQMTEMKLLLTQRDHKVALLENDLCRLNKEKSQMSVLLNSLQKEVTSKDETLRKAKEEIEKYKVEIRNRKNEISTMAARLSKSSELKETMKELKQKEEESNSLKYRLKSLEDKVSTKESHIHDLHARIDEANSKIADDENTHKIKVNDLSYQIKTLQEKLRAKDTSVKDLSVKLTELKTSLSASEQQQLEISSNEIEATKNLSSILCEIENSLIENGRCCKSLNEEINRLQFFEASDNLRWVKECFLSYLCQECNWERDIENALKVVAGDSERAATPPTLLIHLLHEKEEKNQSEITSLERKIKSIEHEHGKVIEDLKTNLKEKYKQKAEKAIKEMRSDEKAVFEAEMHKVIESGDTRLNEVLEKHKLEQEKHLKSIHVLTEEVLTLQTERNKIKNELEILQSNTEQSKSVENEYQEKLEEIDKQSKLNEQIMDNRLKDAISSKDELDVKLKSMQDICAALKESNDLKLFEIEELRPFKELTNDQSVTIKTLESKISSLQLEMDEKLENMDNRLKESQDNEKKLIEEKESAESLTKEVEDILNMNEQLKKTAEEAQTQCDEEKSKMKKVQEELETALANLSDLKGDLSDKDKQKIEHLEEKCTKQEKELLDQQMHLVKLSTLVDEQKKKLIEQDLRLQQQNEILVDRHIPWALKESPPTSTSSPNYPTDLKIVGERCIGKKHDEIISEQKNIIEDLQRSLETVDTLEDARIIAHPKQIVHMSHAIEDLKDELAIQEHRAAVTDQELYDEVCRLKTLLTSATGELTLEQVAHKNNIDALEQCEELYLKFVRDTNRELDIQQILGAEPVSFTPDDERARILTERGKGLEVIVNRIRALKSRLERKDQLLEHYDDDLKNLRETENFAGKKSHEVNALQKELNECRNEVSYLQEALKKWRGECDDLKRQNNSLKQKKVLMMDYSANGSMKTKKPKAKQKMIPSFAITEEVKP